MKKLLILFLLTAFIFPGQIKAGENGLAARLKGRILLQVEAKGEAWYVNPLDLERYYLGRPADAFALMQELGLGVSEADFFAWDNAAPAGLAGRIVLRVQSLGEAYYIEPGTRKPHYLGRPADAFALMREFGLGISNSDISGVLIKDGRGIPAAAEIPSLPPAPELPDAGEEEADNNGEEDADNEEQDDTASSSDESSDSQDSASSTPAEAKDCEFTADYYINKALSGFPYASRHEKGISHEWGSEAPEPLGGRYDLFSVRWTGECYFEDGEYEFTAVFDDAIKAYFDDTAWIFNNWKDNARVSEMTNTLTIEEGYHKIKVEYYEYKHNAEIKLDWKKIN